jgi:hypothetical protein
MVKKQLSIAAGMASHDIFERREPLDIGAAQASWAALTVLGPIAP